MQRCRGGVGGRWLHLLPTLLPVGRRSASSEEGKDLGMMLHPPSREEGAGDVALFFFGGWAKREVCWRGGGGGEEAESCGSYKGRKTSPVLSGSFPQAGGTGGCLWGSLSSSVGKRTTGSSGGGGGASPAGPGGSE